MITLEGIELPEDLVWSDKYQWIPVTTVEATNSLSGALILTQKTRTSGRTITLTGTQTSAWIKKSVIDQLYVLASVIDNELTLDLHGTEYTVKFFDVGGDAISVTDLIESHPLPPEDWNYQIELRFVTC